MKKSTIAAQSSAGIAVLALLTTLAQADSVRYSDIDQLALDMENAATAALEVSNGEIIEIELEMENEKAVWEVDIVNSNNQVLTVEIDGQTGQVLSTNRDDDDFSEVSLTEAVSLSQAIDLIMAVEHGAIVEAELEKENGTLIWEVESIGIDSEESTYRVNAETGEIIL